MTIDAGDLERFWLATSAQPVVSAFRTVPVGVETTEGELLAAVDAAGRRNLLVPLSTRQTLRQDLGGKAVALRQRILEDETSYGRYASLELLDERQSTLFTELCVQVIQRVAAAPDHAVAALRRALEDWRSLLAGNRELLSPSALAGLFGELRLLQALLDRDSGSLDLWTGPTGSAQDFHKGSHAVEVKTTSLIEGRTVHIHGTDQLDVAPNGRLLLQWVRVRTDRGTTVPELVESVRSRVDDVTGLDRLLGNMGYQDAARELYGRHPFEVLEQRTYEIVPGFPRIVPAGLTGDALLGGVDDVHYTLDLDGAAAEEHRTDTDAVAFLLSEGQ